MSKVLVQPLLILWLSVTQASAAQSTGRPIVITIPADIEPRSGTVVSFLQGPFGGITKPERLDVNSRSFSIGTLENGLPADSMKLWVSCRGFEVAMLDFPTATAASAISPSNAFETHSGEYQFLIRSRGNGRLLYRLTPPGAASGRIREQANYPGLQPFRAVKVK